MNFNLHVLISIYATSDRNSSNWQVFLKIFLIGIAAAIIVRIKPLKSLSHKKLTSFTVCILIFIAITQFSSAYEGVPLALLGIAFTLIAGGNSIFGVLTSNSSRRLGQITYGLYLLHGVILYITFSIVFNRNQSRQFSFFEFWGVIFGLIPLIITTCTLSFKYIERPCIRKTDQLAQFIKQLSVFIKEQKIKYFPNK